MRRLWRLSSARVALTRLLTDTPPPPLPPIRLDDWIGYLLRDWHPAPIDGNRPEIYNKPWDAEDGYHNFVNFSKKGPPNQCFSALLAVRYGNNPTKLTSTSRRCGTRLPKLLARQPFPSLLPFPRSLYGSNTATSALKSLLARSATSMISPKRSRRKCSLRKCCTSRTRTATGWSRTRRWWRTQRRRRTCLNAKYSTTKR